jgi:hypothetical protein
VETTPEKRIMREHRMWIENMIKKNSKVLMRSGWVSSGKFEIECTLTLEKSQEIEKRADFRLRKRRKQNTSSSLEIIAE